MNPAWLWGLAPLLPASIALVNLVSWRRPRSTSSPRRLDGVSVLIPARNEGPRIAATVGAALANAGVLEVLVCDDQSSDDTAARALALAAREPRVRLLSGSPLPAGWVGKPHACHQLAQAARGQWLLFLDADVSLSAAAVTSLGELFLEPAGARVVTAVPRQLTETFFERPIVPLLVLTYLAWLPLRLVEWGRSPRTVAANGQLLILRRDDYFRFGGFERVRDHIVDDVAFCRAAKSAGLRVVFADGFDLARCRMYRSAGEVWRGFSKNIFEGLGGSVPALGLTLLLYLGCFVAPYAVLLVGVLAQPSWLAPGLVGVGTLLALRGALSFRFAQPWSGIVLHPLAVLGLCAIAVNSFVWHQRDRITWGGRNYARRRLRNVTPALEFRP